MTQHDNETNIKNLREIIQGNKKKVAVIIGAGASSALKIKTWDAILEEMNKEFGAGIDVKSSIATEGHSKTASKIFQVKNDIEFYKTFMYKQFIPQEGEHYSLHTKIINLFNLYLTTNYDASFEAAFNDLNSFLIKLGHPTQEFGIQKLPQFNPAEILLKPTLIYLHGNNEDGTYVFREEEYETFYPTNYLSNDNSRLEDFLRMIFKDFPLVFIGFSFDDKDFVKFYQHVLDEEIKMERQKFFELYNKPHPQQSLPQHFVIIPDHEITPTIPKKEIISIFGDDSSWTNTFEKISDDFLIFKDDAARNIQLIQDDIKRKSVLDKYDKCNNNSNRLKFFNRMNLKIIRFNVINGNYNELEKILKQLEGTTVGSSIEEAAHAST